MIPTHNTIPYDKRPWVTLSIITLCIVAFLYQLSLPAAEAEAFALKHALVPARYTSADWAAAQGLSRFDMAPFLTSMFLHGGFLHIASNLWTLWVFGPALEDRLGPARYATLYLLSGFAAGAVHVLFNFSSPIPTLGASGAIAGVVAAYARRFPYAWVNILQPVGLVPLFFMMPALVFAGLWFMMQIFQAAGAALAPAEGAGIAWWAHIGGFAVGWLLVRRLGPPANALEDAHDATSSFLWPWRAWSRWMAWWWRRK